MFFLILVFAIALFLYACFGVWPNIGLWALLQWQDKQRYRIHLKGFDSRIDCPAIFVSQAPNLKQASFIRRLSSLPIYWLTEEKLPLLQKSLLKSVHIFPISSLAQLPSNQAYAFLLSETSAPLIQALSQPIYLVSLCGEVQKSSHCMRWTTQDLQVWIHRYDAKKDATLSIAFQYLSAHAWQNYVDQLPSIVESWLEQAKSRKNRLAITDASGLQMSHHRVIAAVLCLRTHLLPKLSSDDCLGILLPASIGCVVSLLTLWGLGKVVVPLNYTASTDFLKHCIQEAGLKKIISSRRFIEHLTKRGLLFEDCLKEGDIEVIYLEDIQSHVNLKEGAKNLLIAKIFPPALLKTLLSSPVGAQHPAAILFSSGSEAQPKGIVLTYRNIMANARQAGEALAAQSQDVMLSVLPPFHAFGLTLTTVLPLLEGLSLVCHPDPTDAAAIGHLAHRFKATLLFSTSTFLRLYALSPPLNATFFNSLRLVVAGGERLSPEVRVLFEEKFKKVIYEGYGTTELSPVCSVNRPDTPTTIRQKMGTVGRAIPGCIIRIIDPETGLDLPCGEAGLVMVGGVNVMKGYLHQADQTQAVVHYEQGLPWYKTGDQGRLDESGFLSIVDRYARFAKIGAEMISLSTLEAQIKLILQEEDLEILALSLPDSKKGEKIVLLYTGNQSPNDIQKRVSQGGLPPLMRPSVYLNIESIPKLATGKIDFLKAKAFCQAHPSMK